MLTIYGYYCTYRFDLFEKTEHFIFYYFNKICYQIIFPLMHISFIFSYLLNGYELTQQLDLFIQSIGERFSTIKSLTIYLLVKLIWDSIYIWNRFDYFKILWKQTIRFDIVASLCAIFIIRSYLLSTWFLMYIHQTLLNICLVHYKQIHSANNTNNNSILEHRNYRSLIYLSKQNEQIRRKFSPIIFLFLIDQLSSLWQQFSTLLIFGNKFLFLLFEIIFRFILWFMVAKLNQNSLKQFDDITNCRNITIQDLDLLDGFKIKRKAHYTTEFHLHLYRNHFQMSAFYLNITISFLINALFYIIGYVVISYQTMDLIRPG